MAIAALAWAVWRDRVAAGERRRRERLEDELRRAREAREAQLEIPIIDLRPAGWTSSDRVLDLRIDVANKGHTAALELVCGSWLGGHKLAGVPVGDASSSLGAGESARWVVHVPADLQPELRGCLQRGEVPQPWASFRDQVGGVSGCVSAPTPGQLDVDEVLDLVRRDEAALAPAVAVRGELVAPAAELVETFADTLVARPHDAAHLPARVRAVRVLARAAARARRPDGGERRALLDEPRDDRPVGRDLGGHPPP